MTPGKQKFSNLFHHETKSYISSTLNTRQNEDSKAKWLEQRHIVGHEKEVIKQ